MGKFKDLPPNLFIEAIGNCCPFGDKVNRVVVDRTHLKTDSDNEQVIKQALVSLQFCYTRASTKSADDGMSMFEFKLAEAYVVKYMEHRGITPV